LLAVKIGSKTSLRGTETRTLQTRTEKKQKMRM